MSKVRVLEPTTREQLTQVVDKDKVKEVDDIIRNFFQADRKELAKVCPVMVILGPVGCGKTVTVKVLAREHRIQYKEYRDDIDCRSIWTPKPIEYDCSDSTVQFRQVKRNFDRFEKYVLTTATFPDLSLEENESRDMTLLHVESPSWACQRDMFNRPLKMLIKKLRHRFQSTTRRVMIVLEFFSEINEGQYLAKSLLTDNKIQIVKFNSATNKGLKKLLKDIIGLELTKEQLDRVIESSMGDIRSCINSLQEIRTGLKNHTNHHHPSKRAKKELSLNFIFARRGDTELLDLFHLLGKILYNKRCVASIELLNRYSNHPPYERPFPLRDNPEDLVDTMCVSSRKLMEWLHFNYEHFCGPTDVTKAGEFLDHLAMADCTSLDSCQTTQFYEKSLADKCQALQALIAVRGTYLSLYYDNSTEMKQKQKKARNGDLKWDPVYRFVQTNHKTKGCFQYRKPIDWAISQVTKINSKMTEDFLERFGVIDSQRVCLDYLPFYLINRLDTGNSPRSLHGKTCLTDHSPIGPDDYSVLEEELNELIKKFDTEFEPTSSPVVDATSEDEFMDWCDD